MCISLGIRPIVTKHAYNRMHHWLILFLITFLEKAVMAQGAEQRNIVLVLQRLLE